MAQLPPRVPNCTLTFPTHNPTPTSQPSSLNDFLDFTSARRASHRRSLTDSISLLDECFRSTFDKLDDDDQVLSLLSDVDIPHLPAGSNSSSASEKQNSSDLAKSEQLGEANPNSAADPKRVKRVIANRQSAQRSRVRKLEYISELEKSVSSLQVKVSALSPRVAFLDHQRLILNVDNRALKQRIAALAQDNLFKDAHQEALKKEIERLRKIYNQQSYDGAPASSEQLITS